MPHATSPTPGFQALILCGPGENLLPFNSNPRDFPKALIPIANRPMVWYPLEWCHRLGASSIHLVTPPECAAALDAALSQNPYLTSLPSPKPTILAPKDLTLTTGTAELLRLDKVQQAITGDFVVLPCDLVCELPGVSLLDAWMTLQGTVSDGQTAQKAPGGLGVWYDTRDANEGGVGVKKEETDFLATTPSPMPSAAIPPPDSLLPRVRKVAVTMPTGTLKDDLDEKGALQLRTQLFRKNGCVKMHTSHRDAHIYFFPHWFKEYVRLNDTFESIGEDAVGWWAKAGWQKGLGSKLAMKEAMRGAKRRKSDPTVLKTGMTEGYDLHTLSSTAVSDMNLLDDASEAPDFASRVQIANGDSANTRKPEIPSLLSYLHPSHFMPSPAVEPKQKQQKQTQQSQAPEVPQGPTALVRRVDTVPLLLSASLYLARLPSMLETLPPSQQRRALHPFTHAHQVHPSTTLPSQATIHTPTVLLDANVELQARITIRDSVIGAKCSIASGSRIHGCLLMEGVVIEEKVVLSGCVIGRRCRIGKESDLKDCFAQEGYVVAEGTKAKGDVLAGFAGGDDDEDDSGDVLDLSGA